MKKALKLALEGAANYIDALGGDSRKYRQALAAPTVQKRPPNCGTGYCSCVECVMGHPHSQHLCRRKIYMILL
jgi:hypothetical protein